MVSNWGGTALGIKVSTAASTAVRERTMAPQRIQTRNVVQNVEESSDRNSDDSTGLFFGKQTDMGTSAGQNFREPEF